jgi:hypothetical protein
MNPSRLNWYGRVIVGGAYYFYRVLLLILPAKFRKEYGQAIAHDFRASCRVAYGRGGLLEVIRYSKRDLHDLAMVALLGSV